MTARRWRGPSAVRHAARRRRRAAAPRLGAAQVCVDHRGAPAGALRVHVRDGQPVTEWAAVAMGKASGGEARRDRLLDASDRHRVLDPADAAPGDPPWWNHDDPPGGGHAFERTREVAQVLPARRSLVWDDVHGVGVGGCVRLRRQRRPARAGAGRHPLACRLSSRCARTRPAPGASPSGSAAAPRRTRCASGSWASSAPSRPGLRMPAMPTASARALELELEVVAGP